VTETFVTESEIRKGYRLATSSLPQRFFCSLAGTGNGIKNAGQVITVAPGSLERIRKERCRKFDLVGLRASGQVAEPARLDRI